MDRASDSGSEGWGFESLPVYQKTRYPNGYLVFCCSAEEGTRRSKMQQSSGLLLMPGSTGMTPYHTCEASISCGISRQRVEEPLPPLFIGEVGRWVRAKPGATGSEGFCPPFGHPPHKCGGQEIHLSRQSGGISRISYCASNISLCGSRRSVDARNRRLSLMGSGRQQRVD